MAYKCESCGHIFEKGEEYVWKETYGFNDGLGQEFSGCPRCHGDYQETRPCKICKSEHTDEELCAGVCSECIDEYRKDFDSCYKISQGLTESIKINSLLYTLFDVKDIEQILIEFIHSNMPDVDCSAFIDNDDYWFAEKISE